MATIETEQVAYRIGRFGLEHVSISVPEGKITAIIGPNGSGKSTLLRLLAKLILPDQGTIYIDHKPAALYKTGELAKTVAMLPQMKDRVPDITVRELVAFGRSPYQGAFGYRLTAEDNGIIDWALKATGTKPLEHRMFHTLSGGEQQRARIAMALAQKTGILLLDEPTTFLDIAHQLEILEMLRNINREYRMTVLMVLHDLQQAVKYSDQVIAVKRGKIVAAGNARDILTDRFLRDVYEIEAKVRYEGDYPLIIPITTIKKE
jgi:ABC-type cobalamin/Fe3+-siderophores transport system ATPase subunit